jgi:hypothetical protein
MLVGDAIRHSADEYPRMTLTFPDGQPFATGATTYQCRPAMAHERMPRITLKVPMAGIMTHAIVDTVGIYLMCHPRLATQLRLEPAKAISGHRAIVFYRVLMHSRLCRLTLTLLPQQGGDSVMQATAFAPEQQEEEG